MNTDVNINPEEIEVEATVEAPVEVDPNAGLSPEEISRKTNGFTPQEAAQELGGVDQDWTGKRLRRHIRGGDCKAQKVQGRWYILIEELEGLLGVLEVKAADKAAKEAAKAQAAAEVEAAAEAPETAVEAPAGPGPTEYPI